MNFNPYTLEAIVVRLHIINHESFSVISFILQVDLEMVPVQRAGCVARLQLDILPTNLGSGFIFIKYRDIIWGVSH